ncbi:hypothetical protein RESH_04092 [Rhodopirellula europaea SH398]|uniref:Uncharacterized protein n=1 Tax=Rhodopirellula europaea SH398 TaxID=1263868 RepID=M5SCH2_9BACT|nr:hypothetical protein RESH_04092 [Rhodopirellula europaea SH398]
MHRLQHVLFAVQKDRQARPGSVRVRLKNSRRYLRQRLTKSRRNKADPASLGSSTQRPSPLDFLSD